MRELQSVLWLLSFVLCSPLLAVKLATVIEGLDEPVGAVTAPGERDRLYVLEQPGKIRVVEKGKLAPKAFLDLTAKIVAGGEMGLLGLAFHPKYAENRRYFVNYTARRPKLVTVIAEYRAGAATEREVLTFAQPYTNHNGGDLAFDRRGLLYVATGDGGSANDPHGNGQSKETLLGKILRIDVDSAKPYGIPADNPFAAGGGRKEIFAWGLRNPWRISFDRETGQLFAADVGQYAWEEIDIVEKGGNYGWKVAEGMHCLKAQTPCSTAGMIAPVHEYSHAEGYSITGGYVYRGKRIPALAGAYIYGDYGSGKIWALHLDPERKKKARNELLLDTSLPISSFGEDPDGEILVVSHKGAIYRLVP